MKKQIRFWKYGWDEIWNVFFLNALQNIWNLPFWNCYISHINSTWLDYQFIGAWGGVWNPLGLLNLWDFLIKTDDSQWQVLSVPCGVGLSLVGLHHDDIVVSLLLKLLPQVHALGREEGHGSAGGILTYQQLCWVAIGAYSSNEQKSRLFRVYMGIIV